MSGRGLVFGSLALRGVWSARQKGSVEAGSAVQAVDAISALTHRQDLTIRRIAELVDAQATPGAGEAYGKQLTEAVAGIEAEVEPKIRDAHNRAQEQYEKKLQTVNAADETTKASKQAADQQADAWFTCVAEQQADQQAIEDATVALVAATDAAAKACQAQEAKENFALSAGEEYKFDMACDLGVSDGCLPQHQSFNAKVDKMLQEAQDAVKGSAAKYAELKAGCEQRTQEAAKAKGAKEAAEQAFAKKELECKKTGEAREFAICQYGHQMQEKCVKETEYLEHLAVASATTEPDRMDEWTSTHILKCMLTRAEEKGLEHPVNADDLQACTKSVNYEEHVGKLEKQKAAFDKMAGACSSDQPVVFGNGQTWEVPTGEPIAAAYAQKELQLPYWPTKGRHPFKVCGSEGLRDRISDLPVIR